MGNHRADHRSGSTRADVATTPVGGSRAAGRRKATRREVAVKPFRRIPAIPTIGGALGIAAAGRGTPGMGPGQVNGRSGLAVFAGSSDAFSGTDAFNLAGADPRAQAISR